MTAMWPFVIHFCIMLPCPLKCVPALCLVPTWWHFLVPWLTLEICWHWLSVMQTSSAIFSVTCSLLSALLHNYHIYKLVLFIVVGINIIVPSLTIFVSYGVILTNIIQICSTEGRSKAFSTCSSHIIAVSLFFGSGAIMYLKPSSAGSMHVGKISSVFYTNVVPMMNPLIYSLRNKDVKLALRKTLGRGKFWLGSMSLCRLS